MKLFGMGSVKDIFIYMRNGIAKIKEDMRLGEIFIDEAVPAGASFPARIQNKDGNGDPVFQEKVIYLKWPLRPRMFIEMRPCEPDDWELKLKNGVYGGSMKEAASPPEDTDVLTIPDVERVPVIRPVMQDEKLMNVDIITERGIFIGLSAVQSSFYLDREEPDDTGAEDNGDIKPGYGEEKDLMFRHGEDPVSNNFKDMDSIAAECGIRGAIPQDGDIPGIAPAETVSNIFVPDDIYHEDIEDAEIEEPELSDMTSGISGKKDRKYRKK